MYFLMLRDDKGESDNIVIVNGWDDRQREEAMAALKTLQSICDQTVTAWLEVDAVPPPELPESLRGGSE